MIVGGPADRYSYRAWRSSVGALREHRDVKIQEVCRVEFLSEISFGPEDEGEAGEPHDDALFHHLYSRIWCCSNLCRYRQFRWHTIHGLFAENESECKTDTRKQHSIDSQEGQHNPWVKYVADWLGHCSMRRAMMVKFLIIDVPSSYNFIFGRPM